MKESSVWAILSCLSTALVTYAAMHGDSDLAPVAATFAVFWALMSIKAAIKEKD